MWRPEISRGAAPSQLQGRETRNELRVLRQRKGSVRRGKQNVSSVGTDRISAKVLSYVLLRKNVDRAKQRDPKAYKFLATIRPLFPPQPGASHSRRGEQHKFK